MKKVFDILCSPYYRFLIGVFCLIGSFTFCVDECFSAGSFLTGFSFAVGFMCLLSVFLDLLHKWRSK